MKKNLLYFCSALLALQSIAAVACPVGDSSCNGVEVEPLFFGQIIIINPSVSHSCTIPAGGTMTCDSGVTILNSGQYGVFQLAGYGSTSVWFCVDDAGTTMNDTAVNPGSTTTLNVKNFTFAPDYYNIGTESTLPGGTLMLKVGATLQTIAGESYDIAPYRGTYNLLINY
jgi:hypothetical protein